MKSILPIFVSSRHLILGGWIVISISLYIYIYKLKHDIYYCYTFIVLHQWPHHSPNFNHLSLWLCHIGGHIIHLFSIICFFLFTFLLLINFVQYCYIFINIFPFLLPFHLSTILNFNVTFSLSLPFHFILTLLIPSSYYKFFILSLILYTFFRTKNVITLSLSLSLLFFFSIFWLIFYILYLYFKLVNFSVL